MTYLVLSLTAFFAGLIQGLAGFGSGPVQMMTYPYIWPMATAAAISVFVSVPLNLNMVVTYFHEVQWKKVLLPIFPYIIICSAAISYSKMIDPTLMKRVFGVFLIVLAAYYLFINKHENKPLNRAKTIVYVSISALCDAFFGIGGPLMVIYFLNKTDTGREYLATVSAFFLINGLYNTAYRLVNGILSASQLPFLAAGMISILVGVTVAHRLVNRMNENVLKKIVYIMIGLTGVFNLFA